MAVDGGGNDQQLRGAVGGAEALPDADGMAIDQGEDGRLDGIAEGLQQRLLELGEVLGEGVGIVGVAQLFALAPFL